MRQCTVPECEWESSYSPLLLLHLNDVCRRAPISPLEGVDIFECTANDPVGLLTLIKDVHASCPNY